MTAPRWTLKDRWEYELKPWLRAHKAGVSGTAVFASGPFRSVEKQRGA